MARSLDGPPTRAVSGYSQTGSHQEELPISTRRTAYIPLVQIRPGDAAVSSLQGGRSNGVVAFRNGSKMVVG